MAEDFYRESLTKRDRGIILISYGFFEGRRAISLDAVASSCVVGPIAQLVELPAHNRLVPGSSPGGPTISLEDW